MRDGDPSFRDGDIQVLPAGAQLIVGHGNVGQRHLQRELVAGQLWRLIDLGAREAELDWAVANQATRDQALVKFGSSWGSLKKFQPEWEAMHGPLMLAKRASGERNGKVKWAESRKE